MRRTASHLFCSTLVAALSTLPAMGEARDDHAGVDSPWHKMCLQGACYVGKSRWSYCAFIGDVALVERNAESGKVLSVELPARINPERAVRITIDKDLPVSRSISECNKFVCRADHKAGAELVDQLKRGQVLVVEAANQDGAPYTLTVTLAGFAKAYDGPTAPVPHMQERRISDVEMESLRGQSERAAAERRARCGSLP